jgi:hypothetical protein
MVLELGKKCDEERLEIKIDACNVWRSQFEVALMIQIRNRLQFSGMWNSIVF